MTALIPRPQTSGEPPQRRKVLIVEDNDLNMKLFNDLLDGAWLRDAADQKRRRGAGSWPASTARI